ncbi:MAG: MSEP-CTERM sorting domain-containing protein, partial [Desulfobacterales bacterium]|nr:MSEP-CTERM sorting domain-containing protein [Desulfobacterales bacterium]
YQLSCISLDIQKRNEILYTFLFIIGIPACWYIVAAISQPLFLGRIPEVITILGMVFSLLLFFIGLLRFFTRRIAQVRSDSLQAHYITVLLIGLIAPFGGLYLNHYIPFPAYFQSVEVYLFTLFNGLLLFPKPNDTYAPVCLFARSICFPFIFYFFIVFLPFLPLSLLAIIAMGAGFLMLAPLVLFVIQLRILMENFNHVCQTQTQTKAVIIIISGILILPMYFMINTYDQKISLNKAIEYIYESDFHEPPPSHLEKKLQAASRSLVKLRDRKQGIQLPYISEFYNYIVFGNMVLPDQKIERMYTLLTGNSIPEVSSTMGFLSARTGFRGFQGQRISTPNRNVELVSTDVKQIDTSKSTLKLVMKNRSGETHSEFLTSIHVQEGIFINGLRLNIDNEFVSGRIVDQKTAMWVYQKITEVRRDPALLRYVAPDTLELRVYPFPVNGTREVEIDFLYPAESAARLRIGSKEIKLNLHNSDSRIYEKNGYIVFTENEYPHTLKRSPYIHFILDFSSGSETAQETYPTRIRDICTRLGISEMRLTAANISSQVLAEGKLLNISDPETIRHAITTTNLNRMGGFWAEGAIKKEMLIHKPDITNDNFHKFPVFVLVLANKLNTEEIKAINLDAFAHITPDINVWYMHDTNGLVQRSFSGDLITPMQPPMISPVYILKRDADISIINPYSPAIVSLRGNMPIEYYDVEKQRFIRMPETFFDPGDTWIRYAGLWEQWHQASMNPKLMEQRRSDLLEQSRSSSMMIPTTSFIVVENSAQWRILERKEEQSLNAKSTFEFEETKTSEPPEIILLGLLVLFILMFHKKIRNNTHL